MASQDRLGGRDEDLVHVLGYLNFSSGKTDPKALQALNRLYGWAIAGSPIPGSPFAGMPAWLTIQQWLQDRLVKLADEKPAFRENDQASRVLQLVWLDLLPEYIDFHRDLLFHQEPEGIFNGFFLGRAIAAVLSQGAPWDETERIVQGAIRELNDYVGYRPVAVLEGRRLEPYPHEWLRPIPLYVADVGVAYGSYYDLISQTLEILKSTAADLRHDCYFDLENLEELAFDPRAYDFDHPVNKRPNYHFGQWDPHKIDNSGNYTRFVVQQVTIDALLARVQEEKELPKAELVQEAAAVLAGTILMASGVSGSGPATFDSTVTLGSLMAPIARNRDRFYDELLSKMQGEHATRLQTEQTIRRQAFGGARQHLNTFLARQRASQLAHVLLARLFARMGSATAAKEESDHVQVPSARILCRIDCFLTTGNQFLQRGELQQASQITGQVRDLLLRGIECGSLVDPWNILGFAGNFPRFTGPDSAVHDHRVEDLIQLMEQVFSFQSKIWRVAASRDDGRVCETVETEMRSLTEWWRKYAAHEVKDLQASDAADTFESASLVARALRLWHQGGAAAGDIRFWAPHAEIFDSPKAYALVIDTLLERKDFVGSMALLVHWLSQAGRVGLQSGQVSFSDLARLWLETLNQSQTQGDGQPLTVVQKWTHIEKFFDYIEANGEHFWVPPTFQLGEEQRNRREGQARVAGADDSEIDSEDSDVFKAAYENFVFKDSTDDGNEGPIYEEGEDNQDELAAESKRLTEHLTFLNALASMWKSVALSPNIYCDDPNSDLTRRQIEALQRWCDQSSSQRLGLVSLTRQLHEYRISRSSADQESMSRYDRKRMLKESLLERVIGNTIETSDGLRMLLAVVISRQSEGSPPPSQLSQLPEEDQLAVCLFADLMAGRRSSVEEHIDQFLVTIRSQRLLYLPLARGGVPDQILAVRLRRRVLGHLLSWLPRQGLFFYAIQLLDTARFMEHQNPVGPGAVTEFDELFQMGFKSMVRCIVRNGFNWHATDGGSAAKNSPLARDPKMEVDDLMELTGIEPPPTELIPLLENLTEVMLSCWLQHSRTLRLSILETVDNSAQWKQLVEFIEKYGANLFTQTFLKLGNVRAILHQGIPVWLERAKQDGDHEELQPILDAIERGELNPQHAHRWLNVVLEAIIDHYSEYRDYNSTTTQSDRGEMLYMFLDFLRLRVRYDRVNWNLRPVSWAHEVLVRSGCPLTGQAWRRALADRIGREADQYQKMLNKLQDQYAMRMPTVADRLGERFIKPMTIDRMRALVRPAMKQLGLSFDGRNTPAFDLLVQEARLMTREPTGIGFEAPPWLSALEEEVERVHEAQRGITARNRYDQTVPMLFCSVKEIESQLRGASQDPKNLNPPES